MLDEGACQQLRIIEPTYCGAVCADCYLVGATQSVAECGCVCAPIHISARHCFVLVLLLCKEASIHQKDQL